MAPCHLITLTQFTLRCNKHLDKLVNARIKIITLRTLQPLHIDNGSLNAVRYTQRGIADIL